MLSVLKDHIIFKITGLTNVSHSVTRNALYPLIRLDKLTSTEAVFILPKDEANQAAGITILPDKIETDSLLLKTVEKSEKDTGKQYFSFSFDRSSFLKYSLSRDVDGTSVKKKHHVLVEFSSPNIAKPFHIGHLRSTIVGNFIANCCEELYGRVTRMNYLGDWGAQVGYVVTGYEDLAITNEELSNDPFRTLYRAYVHAYNQSGMQESAKRIFAELEFNQCERKKIFWEKVRQLSMNNLQDTYKNLGIKFDEYSYESDYRISRIEDLLVSLESHGLAKRKSPGGLMVLCAPDGSEIPLTREDGTSLYLSRDIAAALDRIQRYGDCEKLFYVVDKSQVEHFQNISQVIYSMTGKDLIQHIQFGRVTGVSSRKGTTLLLQDILDKATDKMAIQQRASANLKTNDPEVTRILAVTLLMVYMLKQARCRDFVFNWDLAMLSKGDCGVKMQYTHCRLCSLEKHCGVQVPSVCEPDLLKEQILLDVIVMIARCDEVLLTSTKSFESYYLTSYLFKLCNQVSRCLSQIPVKGQPKEIAEQRLLVYHQAKETIARCMSLLGLVPLERM